MAAADPFSTLLHQVEEHEAATRRAAQQRATRYIPQTKAPDPSALVLVTTVYTCECGRVYRSPNPHVLVRYDEKGYQNSVHYSRSSVSPYFSLKREHKVIERTVPWCEECFGREAPAAQLVSVVASASVIATAPADNGVGLSEPPREGGVATTEAQAASEREAPVATLASTRFAGQRSIR